MNPDTFPLGMSDSFRQSDTLGFLTVVDHARYGLVGGFLVLNPAGRPLEFHCTSPVKPNRAQEILYGNTLKPYLYGEQMARVLLTRSRTPVRFVLTDTPAILPVQEFVAEPIVLVSDPRNRAEPENRDDEDRAGDRSGFLPGFHSDSDSNERDVREISEELDASLRAFGIENANLQRETGDRTETAFRLGDVPGLDIRRWEESRIGHHVVAVPATGDTDRAILIEELKAVSRTVDLAEPFTRIRRAIEEAQRAA